jgi:RNAse (barnase) inhibitor barstar
MSKSQSHGKMYENYIKSAFTGASDYSRPQDSLWDIEEKFDNIDHLPTSIKVTSSGIVDLADARRFWLIDQSYRLLVAEHNQKNKEIKQFINLHEFLILYEEHCKLLGNISYKDIEDFHNNLLIYKFGKHNEARLFSKNRKILFKEQLMQSTVQLNPKIDSKTQRRLQCSISLDKLIPNINKYNFYDKDDFYRDISVYWTIKHSERLFSD